MKSDKGIERLILILFFFSGFCGMIYVIAWIQGLRLFLAPPLLTIISVLIIFLGGLALGSYFAGRFIDKRSNPIKIYGVLEGALGIYSLALPWLIHGVVLIYKANYQNIRYPFNISLLFRFLLSALILLLPSVLIGAVWPVISKLLMQKIENSGWTLGKIYGINILGGSVGALTSGLFFLPHFGVNSTIYFSACIDLIICICAILLYKNLRSWRIMPEGASSVQTDREVILKGEGGYRRVYWIILIGFGLSGAAATIYQLIWLRVLTIFLDSSFLALSLISSIFLLGLALGSLSLARFFDRRKDPLLLLGLIEMIIGLSSLGIIPLLERYPLFISSMAEGFANSFWVLQLTGFSLLFFIMLMPTLLLGLSFPLTCRILSDNIQAIGKSISRVFSINALGCLIGALSGGILIVTWLGIKKGGLVPVWSHIFIGYIFVLFSSFPFRKIKISLLIILAGFFIVFSYLIPVWEIPLFRDDPYRYAYNNRGNYLMKSPALADTSRGEKKETLFSKEGIASNISVIKNKDDIYIKVNGRIECSTKRDLTAEVLAGHIPLLLHSQPMDILLIGVAGGITVGSIEQYPVREIECIEISQGVIEGSEYLNEFNNNALKDPRVKMIIEDARHYLTFTGKRYDVIIFRPSNSRPGAITELLTKGFFRLCQQRLRSGGVVAMNIPVRDMNAGTFKSILFAWHDVFPIINLWETNMGKDCLLIGSNQDLKWDYTHITERTGKAEIASDLSRVNIKDPPLDILAFYFINNQGLPPACFAGRVFSDIGTQRGFFTPRLINREKTDYPLKDMQQYRGNGLTDILRNLQGIDDSELKTIMEKIRKAIEARRFLTNAYIDLIKNESRDKVLDGLKEALRINPEDRKAIELYSDMLFANVEEYTNQKRFDLALWTLLELIRITPDNLEAHYLLGRTYYNMGLIDQAIAEYEMVIESRPEDEEVHCQLGIAYLNNGWIDLSISLFKRAIRINPDYADPHLYLGAAYFKKDMIDHAIEEYKNAIALGPSNADAHYNLGIAYLKIGMIDEAVSEWQEVIRIRPDDINSRYNLAMTYYNHGDIDQSITQLEEAIKYRPDFSQARSLLEILYQIREEE